MNRLISLFLIICLSCRDGGHSEKFYYDTGELRKLVEYLEDSVTKETFYFKNGTLKSFGHKQYGVKDGYYETYFEDGNIHKRGFYQKGRLDGISEIFYQNGQLLQLSSYKSGIRHGIQKSFDSLGNPFVFKNYLNFRGEEQLTGMYKYDENGNIIEQTIRVVTIPEKDTVKIPEEITVNIELVKPRFDSTRFILGNYDEFFNLIDSLIADTLYAVDHKVVYKLNVNKPGTHFLRGYADNFKFLKDSLDMKITKHSHTYFECVVVGI